MSIDEYLPSGSLLGLYGDVLGRTMKLPRSARDGVRVERDLRVPMDDGVVLRADRYAPREAGPMPTVLVRTPDGRGGPDGLLYGPLHAQRRLQGLGQSVRGTVGSGGGVSPVGEGGEG